MSKGTEKEKLRRREYYRDNRDRIRERTRVWRLSNRDKDAATKKAYYELHGKKCPDPNSGHAWRSSIQKNYGMSEAQYNDILSRQGGACAICKTTPENGGRRLAVDHCHTIGPIPEGIRGLLCFNCNVGIGKLGDTAGSLEKAFIYLKKFEEINP